MRLVQMGCDCMSGSGQKFQRWQPFSLLVIRVTGECNQSRLSSKRGVLEEEWNTVLYCGHQSETEPFRGKLTTTRMP
jgi:hypothetical protein